ncbi:MFS transporter [Cupriavidus basilensis]|uniref:4-hydroxybenzoate transporter n=1 Tax=Cupriavidus basilensis TaxID=68895 RepID=A0A0C4YI44_9BURK|nr:MFS transporter [Cupriavidus basilensis]AJG22280.1 4-hydroxybenzoate transporter [Cupriavidus basilensis]
MLAIFVGGGGRNSNEETKHMTSTATINASLAHTMDGKSMTFFQWRAIGLCFLINMLDSFDAMVMAFTAASVSAHWSLTGAQLGYLLSAGLVGMTVGSLFIAPWADRIGRRPLVLLCIVVAGLGRIASDYARTPTHLGLLRFVTGLGIGGILASSYVIDGEYASAGAYERSSRVGFVPACDEAGINCAPN